MPRESEWMSMSVRPDYDGHYDVEVDGKIVNSEYFAGSWNVKGGERWRGLQTRLRRSEVADLKEALAKHPNSAAYRSEAALAALQLARAAQERAARSEKRGPLKAASRYFRIAVSLSAPLQTRDKEFMQTWWPRLKPGPKKKVEAEVQAFLSGKPVRFL